MACDKGGPSLVLDWLSNVESIPEDLECSACPIDGSKESTQAFRTPDNKESIAAFKAELSPTDTDFSFRSIFDEPCHSSEGAHETGSICSNSSDECSVSECCPSGAQRRRLLSQDSLEDLAPASLNSYEPPSVAESTEQTVNPIGIASIPLQEDEKGTFFVVSCLQCTLVGLRCSRTVPACSRCVRNGVECCLVQRRQKPHELNDKSLDSHNTPVLVRLKDEDDRVWRKKEQLAQEVSTTSMTSLDLDFANHSGS